MTTGSPTLEKSKLGSIASTSTAVGSSRSRSTRVAAGRPSVGDAERPFGWLTDVDLLFKQEVVAALEDEAAELGFDRDLRKPENRQRLTAMVRESAAALAKSGTREDEVEPPGRTRKQMALLRELDRRLREYHLAVLRNRDVHDPDWRHAQSSQSSATTGADGKKPPPQKAAVDLESSQSLRDRMNSRPTLRMLVVCAVFTVVFIIGGMVGLFFEQDRAKRVGLVIFLVTLLIILLTVMRLRPVDIFLLGAAYAAVLVVFLSGDLAGPQEVIVDLTRGGNGELATAAAASTSASLAPSTDVSPVPAAAPTAPPEGVSSFATVVTSAVETPFLWTTTSTPLAATATDAPSPETPTSTPPPDASSGYWNSGRIAGVAIGTIAGIALIVVIGLRLLKRYS